MTELDDPTDLDAKNENHPRYQSFLKIVSGDPNGDKASGSDPQVKIRGCDHIFSKSKIMGLLAQKRGNTLR